MHLFSTHLKNFWKSQICLVSDYSDLAKERMNYIHHMNSWFAKVQADERLYPGHISLYLALFQFWNANRFRNPLSIARSETNLFDEVT